MVTLAKSVTRIRLGGNVPLDGSAGFDGTTGGVITGGNPPSRMTGCGDTDGPIGSVGSVGAVG